MTHPSFSFCERNVQALFFAAIGKSRLFVDVVVTHILQPLFHYHNMVYLLINVIIVPIIIQVAPISERYLTLAGR